MHAYSYESEDDDEEEQVAGDGMLEVLSAESLGLFVWSEDYHLNELHEPRVKAWQF